VRGPVLDLHRRLVRGGRPGSVARLKNLRREPAPGARGTAARGVRRREQTAPEEEPRRGDGKRNAEAGLGPGLGLLGQALVGLYNILYNFCF